MHKLTFERSQYPSGQFKATCLCGWSATADAETDALALKMLEQMHSEHVKATAGNGSGAE